MSRLFFALWPDRRVRAEIHAWARAIPLAAGRLVPEANIHITLVFLGNVDAQTRAALIAAAASVQLAPFPLILDRLGWWKKPRIAWMAPSACPRTLLRLVAELSRLSQRCGVAVDARPYQAHVTFARKVTRPIGVRPLRSIPWNINKFCLLESKACRGGVEYQVKASWPLKIM